MTIEEREARAVTPTWQHRERRILDYVVWVWERNERAEVADIAEALGLDYALTVRVVDELRKGGQLTGVEVAQDPYLLRIEPTAKARRELGQWPTRGDELYDRFIAVLTERIAAEPDEAKRTRLEKLLGVTDDVGRSALGGVLVEVAKLGAGIGP